MVITITKHSILWFERKTADVYAPTTTTTLSAKKTHPCGHLVNYNSYNCGKFCLHWLPINCTSNLSEDLQETCFDSFFSHSDKKNHEIIKL